MTTYICAYAFTCFIYELYVDETEINYGPRFDVEGVGRNFCNGERGAKVELSPFYPRLRNFIEPSCNFWSAFCAFLRTFFTNKTHKFKTLES